MARERSDTNRNDYSVRSVERVCTILERLSSASGGESLVDLAEVTELPKSSVFRYLATLERRGFVERTEDGTRFRLGIAISRLRATETERLLVRAEPLMASVRDDLGETVNIGRLDGTEVVYVAIAESEQAIRMAVKTGDRELLHCTALGKVLAAQLPEDDVRTILADVGMPRKTPNTVTNVSAFIGQLAAVREQGYALDQEENEPGGICVAVPVPGYAAYALSLSGPSSRVSVDQTEAIAGRLTEAAERLTADSRSGSPAAA